MSDLYKMMTYIWCNGNGKIWLSYHLDNETVEPDKDIFVAKIVGVYIIGEDHTLRKLVYDSANSNEDEGVICLGPVS